MYKISGAPVSKDSFMEYWVAKQEADARRYETDPVFQRRTDALNELARLHQELDWPDEPMETLP